MRFWDSSAIVPLIIVEGASPLVRALFETDRQVLAWWGTEVECAAAFSRRLRTRESPEALVAEARQRLRLIASEWDELAADDEVRRIAILLLGRHPLQAADSLQLAAAIIAADGQPAGLPFVTLDTRLGDAARAEGFNVRP